MSATAVTMTRRFRRRVASMLMRVSMWLDWPRPPTPHANLIVKLVDKDGRESHAVITVYGAPRTVTVPCLGVISAYDVASSTITVAAPAFDEIRYDLEYACYRERDGATYV